MKAAERRTTTTLLLAAASCAAALLSSPARAQSVSLVAYSSAPAAVDSSTTNIVLFSFSLEASGGSVNFNSARFYLHGEVPPQNIIPALWRDDGDGVFNAAFDVRLNTGAFTGGGPGFPPDVTLTAGAETVNTGSPRRYFLTADFVDALPGRKLAFALFNPWDVAVTPSNFNPWPAFPVQTSPMSVYTRVFASPAAGAYATPASTPNTGGFDTGLYLSAGQRLAAQVRAGDQWDAGSGLVDGDGGAPAGGLGASFNKGALVGRIGAGSWFLLGQNSTVTAAAQGPLYVAANDTGYGDNSGFLRVLFDVLPSTTAKVWVGGTLGFENRADLDNNWTGGAPREGERAVFDSSSYDCDWNIQHVSLSELSVSTAFAPRRLRLVSPPFGGSNELRVGQATIGGGTFTIAGVSGSGNFFEPHRFTVDGLLVVRDSATFDLGAGRVIVRDGIALSNGAFLVHSSSGSGTGSPRIESVSGDNGRFFLTVERATVSVTAPLSLEGVDYVRFDQAAFGAFDFVRFFSNSFSTSPFVEFRSPTPVSYSFKGWESGGVTRSTGVAATAVAGGSAITFLNSVGTLALSFGSPKTDAAPGVVTWNPDGGGAAGSINGNTSCSAGGCAGVSYRVLATTDPAGRFTPYGSVQSFGANGPYGLSLNSPATYYLLAFSDTGFDQPFAHASRGGHGHPGHFVSEPVFLPAGGTVNSVDIDLKPWGAAQGAVSNPTAQVGPLVVETWDGAPYAPGSTRAAQGFVNAAGGFLFETAASDGGVGHSSHVVAYVDLDGDRSWDVFEASASAVSPVYSPAAASTASFASLTLSGGGNAAGGTLTVSSQAVHVGAVGNASSQPLFYLDLGNTAAPASLSALRLRYDAPIPPGGVDVQVYEDDGDGVFSANMDRWRGDAFFNAGDASTKTAVFYQPVQVPPSGSRRLFVTLNTFSAKPSSAAVSIDAATDFGMAVGTVAVQPALYPIHSGAVSVRTGVPADYYASPDGNGGAFTGAFVAGGQSLFVFSSGTWRTGPSDAPTGAAGAPGTTGLDTILPSANRGELIGRLASCAGCPSSWFRVGGATLPLTMPFGGDLYLAINDYVGASYDNSGQLLVDFAVSGTTTGVLVADVSYPGNVGPTSVSITAYQWGLARASQTVAMSGASQAFSFQGLPPGEYTLGAQTAGSDFGVGAEKKFLAAGDTVTLRLDMFGGTASISGSINYAGVLNYGNFFIGASTSSDFSGPVFFLGQSSQAAPGAYSLTGLPAPNTYYLVCFRDGNFNQEPDGPEPFGYHGAPGGGPADLASYLAPVFVSPSDALTGKNLDVQDTGGVQGRVTTSTSAAGLAFVEAGRGLKGAPGYKPEARAFVPVYPGATAGAFYSLGLMRTATDYSLFAFLDQDGDGSPGTGEPSFQTAANMAVSSGSMARFDFSLLSAAAPPAVGRFSAVATGTSTVFFSWDGVAGATNYHLRRGDDSLYLTLNATYFVDATLSANTSSQILKVVAANGNGESAALALSTAVYSLADAPNGLVAFNLSASGADVGWGGGTNSLSTQYRLYRSTVAAGVNARLLYTGPAGTVHDGSVAPGVGYYWDVAAVNGNGLETYSGAPASGVTPAAAGSVFIGSVTYAGLQAGPIVVQASTASDFTGAVSSASLPNLPAQPYLLALPGAGGYFLRAFVDVLGDGALQPGADRFVSGVQAVGGAPFTLDFAVGVDTVPPAAPAGLVATPSLGAVTLNWAAPNKNADGSPLTDLLGYEVRRASAPTAPFAPLAVPGGYAAAPPFLDDKPLKGPNYYRVAALDLGRNASPPSASLRAAPSSGGSISGFIAAHTVAGAGPFRVRLTSSPAPGAPALAEVSLVSYTFSGLSDGSYYLRGYRDTDFNGAENPTSEPGGTYGGLNTPFVVPIVGGNAVTGADVAVCDRTQLMPGASVAGSLDPGGCPARDKSASAVTQLFSIPVGNGQPGSIGLGSVVSLSITTAAFGDSELIVLGPDGSVVARDNRPGGASLSFTASQAGVYLVEPTSFLPGLTGGFTLKMRLDGGFGGSLSGAVAYSGARPGKVHLQLYDSTDSNAAPRTVSTYAAPGAYSLPGLPDGVYYLRAFRDANDNGVRDPGEPSGQYGFSASSPTPILVSGGFTSPLPPLGITLADPAVGTMRGTVIYQGTQPGQLRVQAGLPSCAFCDLDTLVAQTTAAAGAPYQLDFLPAATNYILRAFVDNNANGRPDVLEAVVSSRAVTVTAAAVSTVSVILQDPGAGPAGTAVLAGTVTYAGAATGTIFVGFSRDPQFNNLDIVLQLPATGYFQRAGVLGGATYYMAGFIDNIPNGSPDFQSGEPRGTGGLAGAPGPFLESDKPPVYVADFGVTQTSMTIFDAPTGSVRGKIAYTGSSPAQAIIVQAARWTGPNSPPSDFVEARITRSAGVAEYPYQLDYMSAAPDYSVHAFVDANGNGRYDNGEPSNGRYPVQVSSGAGTFPVYGTDLRLYDAGGFGTIHTAGRVRGDVSYLGSQSGPVFVRFFTSDSFTGVPYATVMVPGAPGPGNFPFEKSGLPLDTTFYLDAFRDPSGAGVYNPTFHARAPLTQGGAGLVLTQSSAERGAYGHIVDPGEGGSVNAFSGRLDVPAGARFDGGAFDVAAAVVIDTWTGAPPPTYVAMHVTTQNDGPGTMLVRYTSAGVVSSYLHVGAGLDGVRAPVPTAGGFVLMPFRHETQQDMGWASTAAVARFDADFGSRWDVEYALRDARAYAYSPVNQRLYVADSANDAGDLRVLEIDPAGMNVTSTGSVTLPGGTGCSNCGDTAAYALAVSPDGQKITVLAISGRQGNDVFNLMFLARFNRPGGPILPFDVMKDVTGLNLPADGATLAYDASGSLFASGVKKGETTARTYRFDAALNQTAAATLPDLIVHFEGGIGNMKVDPADGHVYQAWESSANAGDFHVLRYDNDLNLLLTRTFDGRDNTAEDFPFSLEVLDSSNVVVAGGVNNGRSLDSALVRFNMNAGGAASAPGAAVVVATTQAVFGTASYAGALASSGAYRTVLLPAGETTPLRFSSAAFAASYAYLFNNIPFGLYHVRSFIDLNGNLIPEAGEPVGWSKAAGEEFLAGSSYAVAALPLCDRRAIAAGVPVSASFSASDCPAPDRGGAYQRLYTFTGRRGEPVTLQLEGLGFTDTYLNLYGPDGELVASADDGGAAPGDALINGFILPEDGLYTVGASPFAAGVTGAFRLSLTNGSGAPGSVSGLVEYAGVQGGAVQVVRFSSTVFSSSTVLGRQTLLSTRAFTFAQVPAGATYYFGAFVDVNANGLPDAGEDAGVFGSAGVPAPVYVQVGQAVTGVTVRIAASSAAANASFITGQTTMSVAAPAGQVVLEFWSSAQFTGRPVGVRLVPTGVGSFDVPVAGGVAYYIRAFLDLDGDFVPDANEPKGVYAPRGQGAESVFAPAGSSVVGVDIALAEPGRTAGGAYAGEGAANLVPSSAAGGQQVPLQIIVTAGPHGLDLGAQIGFTVPSGFPFPSGVTASNTGGATLSAVTHNGPSAFVTITAGAVAQGFTVTFDWPGFSAPCQQGANTINVVTAEDGTAAPAPLLDGSPVFTVNAGLPEFVSVNPPYFSLRVGELSEPLFVETRDRCGNKVAAGAAEVLALRAKAYNPGSGQFETDPSIGLTTAPALSTGSAVSLDFAIGQSSRVFHAVALSTGFKYLELYSDLGAAPEATFYFGASVLPADSLTNVRVSTSVGGVAGATATIALAGAGAPNQVFVDFSLGDPSLSWHVLFSTTPFKPGAAPTPVWERWGGGQPTVGEIAWDGRYSPWLNGGGRAPNGLYYGRVEVAGGGVKDDRLQVRVDVPQFSGRVYDSAVSPNPPLSGASLRVYGPAGFFSATTGSDGTYNLPGLGAGSYRLNVSRPDYVDAAVDATLDASAVVTAYAPRTAGVAVSSNASGGLDVFLGRAPRLVVAPSLDAGVSTESFHQWGSLQVRPSTGSQLSTLFGPMRLRAGATFFDDGGQWDPGTQRFVERTQLSFNVPVGTYTVQGELAGFTRSSETVYVGADGAVVALSPFQKKSTVRGEVSIPGPNPNGTFVSVSAVPLSTSAAAAGGFGGVFLNPGELVSSYVVGGLDAGAYLLRANAQGLSVATTGPLLVPANTEVPDYHFPVMGAGVSITGVVTVVNPPDDEVHIHAWAPGSLNFGSTVTFLSGGAASYELKGLDAGATYQIYASLFKGPVYDVDGGFPISVAAPAVLNFTMRPSSGAVSGLIQLAAGATDFLNVELRGLIVASLRPQEVGQTFVEVSTTLPGFLCGDDQAPVNPGYCPGVSSATFLVQNLNTQTLDLTFFHRTTGQNARQRLSVVNGSTTTLTVDLSGVTYSISGSVVNQVSNGLYNTNAKIVSSAPYIAPQGWPAGLSSSTARVTAIRQDLESYGVAISTVFNEATSRVGFITAGGTFTISNVPNGVYFVRTTDLRACATCDVVVPSVGRVVAVGGANVTGADLAVSDGYSVAGTIALDGEMSDWAVFDISVLNRRQEVVRSTTAYLGDPGLGVVSNEAAYRFNNLPAGQFYTLVARDRRANVKYVGRPIKFPDPALSPNGLQSSLSGQDIVMKRAGVIVGRLKDGGTGELIGASNAGKLAPNFRVTATANPWIEGGFVVAAASVAGRPVEVDGYFRVGPLLPDVSYDLRLAQTSWDPSFLQQGSQNYAPVTIGGLRLASGETRDVGVVALAQGRSITGVVRSTAGVALGAVKVTATPSFGDESELVSQTFTNNGGVYTLWVSTEISNQFHVTAAPRDGNKASDGLVYGQVTLRNVNLLSQATADFLLTPLPGSVTGQVVVADAASGGVLSYPFGEQRGFPAAAVNLQPKGVVSDDPLGDISAVTDERGFFSVPGLATGTYTLHATSLGYGVFNATASVTTAGFRLYVGSDTASNDLPGSVITLQRGATVTGRILKSDGSAPAASEVRGVAAANFAAGEFVVGSVETDAVARTVSAYTISGFRPGVSYDIVLISGEDGRDVSFPTEGDGVLFTAAESTSTKSINLTFKPSRLDCLGTAKALDAARTQFQVKIDCLKPLRGTVPADDDLDLLMTVSTYTSAGAALAAPNGAGSFQAGSKGMGTNRRLLTGVYQTAANEARFSVRVRAAAADVDPTTGQNFTIDKVFDFFTGLESAADGRVTNIDGGSLSMTPSAQDELLGLDERARLDIRPGSFAEGADSLPDSSVVANPTVTVNVTMTKGRDRQLAQTLFLKKQGFIPAGMMASESGGAYPAEVWAAMSAYRTQASTTQIGGANPLSSFYSIFLPAGIRHQLKQRADLTLSYDTVASTSTTDDEINVWFYNATLGRYVLESTDRRLDPVNKTITVSVDHFSTFVVLDSTPVLTSDVSFAGTDIIAASFPNPADCIPHSGIQRNTGFFASGVIPTFTGQMIRASLPPGAANDLTVNVYNLSGQKVRSLPQGSVPGGKTYYMPWNCSNDDGRTVSSGVYLGEIKWGSFRKFIKMAIIKGSGL